MPATLKSRIPEIQFELPAKVTEAIHVGAQGLADTISERAPRGDSPPHLGDEIEVELRPQAASIYLLFYWYFLEYGTVHMPAHPFVRPAIEASYGQIYADIRAALKNL